MNTNEINNGENLRFNLWRGWILWLIVLACTAAVAIFLLHSPANFAETHNLQLVTQSSPATVSLGTNDDPMPLYFLLEQAWIHFAAVHIPALSGLTAARLLSLLFYPLSVLALYFAGLAATKNRRVAIAGAMLLGLSPFMLWYSSRATMYSLLVFAVLLNQYFFSKLLDNPKWWHWPGYLATGLLGLGVHYFFAVILLIQFIFYITRTKWRLGTLWLFLCVVLLALAFGWWIHYSTDHTLLWHYLPHTSRPSATNPFIVFVEYLFGFQSIEVTTLIISFWPLLVVIALLAIQKYISPPPAIQYSFWATVAPVIGMFLLAWVWKPLFLSSYLIIGLAPLMLLLGWYFVALRLRVLQLACYGLMALMTILFIVEISDPSWALQNDYLGLNPGKPLTKASVRLSPVIQGGNSI